MLALVGLASANLNYNSNGRTVLFNGQNSYGNLLSSGSLVGLSGGLVGGLSGLNGLSLANGYSSGYSSGYSLDSAPLTGLVLSQAAPSLSVQALAPVSYATQQLVAAPVARVAQVAQASQISGPIQAAVQSTRSVEVVDAPSTGGVSAPQSLVIGPSVQPIDIEFQSQSSPVSVRQSHIPGQPNPPQVSRHQEEPDLLRQEIVKPVVHEVTEAIQPIRRVTQQVLPVQETVSQVLTRGQQQQQQVQYVQQAPVQTASLALQPVQTVAVQAVAQPRLSLVAQPTLAVAAQPTLAVAAQPTLAVAARPSLSLVGSGSGTARYNLDIQNLNPRSSGLALTGSSFSSYPSLSLRSSSLRSGSLVAPDVYRK